MTLTAIAEEILARAKEIDEGVSRSDAQCHREEFLDLLRELEQQILGPSEWILKQIYSVRKSDSSNNISSHRLNLC